MTNKRKTKLGKALSRAGLSSEEIEKVKSEARTKRSDAGISPCRKKYSITWFMDNENLTFSQARRRRLKFLEAQT